MKKALVVEDDPDIRDIYQLQFRQYGYQLDTASDGEEALNKIFSDNYDCVLLDIMMPKLDGVHALELIREREKTENRTPVPVIMLTNLGENSVLARCKALGAAGILIKARYTPKEIIAEIEKILNKTKEQTQSEY